MGGGGKSGMGSMSAPAAAEAPKPYSQEQAMDDEAQSARDDQLKKARAALGQEGSIKTSPFGTQRQAEEKQTQQGGKTLLGS